MSEKKLQELQPREISKKLDVDDRVNRGMVKGTPWCTPFACN